MIDARRRFAIIRRGWLWYNGRAEGVSVNLAGKARSGNAKCLRTTNAGVHDKYHGAGGDNDRHICLSICAGGALSLSLKVLIGVGVGRSLELNVPAGTEASGATVWLAGLHVRLAIKPGISRWHG